jgi:hypothetical protein
MSDKENIRKIDEDIYDILIDITDPAKGWTIREITRYIWDYPEDAPAGEQFYNRAKLVERRIGSMRHNIYADIRKEMKTKKGTDEKITKPKFLPYALPDGKYWRYFNASTYERMPDVIKLLRIKADGLISNADVLAAIFEDMI